MRNSFESRAKRQATPLAPKGMKELRAAKGKG